MGGGFACRRIEGAVQIVHFRSTVFCSLLFINPFHPIVFFFFLNFNFNGQIINIMVISFL